MKLLAVAVVSVALTVWGARQLTWAFGRQDV